MPKPRTGRAPPLTPDAMRWDCNWRVQFKPGERDKRGRLKHSTMNVSWFVWDSNRQGQQQWGLLDRSGPVEGPLT